MPILPIGMYHIYGEAQVKDAFILPQYWSNDAYRQCYMTRLWDTVIIDNAMYEQIHAVKFNDLINIASTLTAKRIFIVPPEDVIDPSRTVLLALNTIVTYGVRGANWEMMVIVHGEDQAQLIHQMEILHDADVRGFGIVVSYWRAGKSRADLLKAYRPADSFMHALGLDDIDELPWLRRAGYNSCDSSIVATAAVNGIHLQSSRKIVRNGMANDPKRVDLMQTAFGIKTYREALRNTMLLKVLCEG